MIPAPHIAALIVLALSAHFLTLIVRALVPLSWMMEKPWSCDLCMSWWTSIVLVGAWMWFGEVMPIQILLVCYSINVLAVASLARFITRFSQPR